MSNKMLIFLCIVKCLEEFIEAKPNSTMIDSVKNDQISETIGNLVDRCFEYRKAYNILISDGSEDTRLILNSLLRKYTIPTCLFQSGTKIFKHEKRFEKVYFLNETILERKRYPVSSATIFSSNPLTFSNVLNELMDSIWWNHEAHVFVVNSNFTDSCQMAQEFLNIAWKYRMTSVIYVCKSLDSQILLYTFNPFANLSPKLWRKAYTTEILGTPWTLFVCSYKQINAIFAKDYEICMHLFFCKTKDLYGYNLKAVALLSQVSRYNITKKGFDRCGGFHLLLFCMVFKHLNATITIKTFSSYAHIDDNGEPQGPLKDVLSSSADVSMNSYFIRNYWRLQVPFDAASLKIVTSKVPVRHIDNLATVFNLEIFYILFTAIVFFVIILKFVLKQSINLAIFNFIRIIAGNAIIDVPKNWYGRISFMISMFSALMIGTVIQSCLSAINTMPGRRSIVDTSNDLFLSDLQIHGFSSHKEMLLEKFQERYVITTNMSKCIERLLKDDLLACLVPNLSLGYYVYESNRIHISNENLVERSITLLIAENSPFLGTFRSILLKMGEGGFIKLYGERDKFYYRYKYQSDDQSEYLANFFTIEQFIIVFVVQLLGWILGTVILCFEIFIFKVKYYYNRRSK